MSLFNFLLTVLPNPFSFKIPAESIKFSALGKTFTISESGGTITISYL